MTLEAFEALLNNRERLCDRYGIASALGLRALWFGLGVTWRGLKHEVPGLWAPELEHEEAPGYCRARAFWRHGDLQLEAWIIPDELGSWHVLRQMRPFTGGWVALTGGKLGHCYALPDEALALLREWVREREVRTCE